METQTWLSCHNKFILVENITLLSVSSDDFLLAILAATSSIVIYKALCFDVAQGRMNWAPNENRTHSCRFV